jgi:hypothetical protein
MEFIVEFVFDLLFEGGVEITKDKKISKWIRYPILAIIALFFGVIIFGLIAFGIKFLIEGEILISILFIGLGLFFLIESIYKFRKTYIEEFGEKSGKKSKK